MPRIVVDRAAPDPSVIRRAADLLRAGRLVAFPTETVYGLGANALDPEAVERIYAAKGRPSYNPLIVHVDSAARVHGVAREWPDAAARLAAAFWPGPLTVVVPRRDVVAPGVSAGLATVAVRVPSHPVAQALLAAAELPVAAPSANKSMAVSPTTGVHVESSLGDAVDLILDAGPTRVGIESTVIDVTSDPPRLLRPGIISVPTIERVIGPIVLVAADGSEAPRASPGMLDRHYAPRARVVLVDTSEARARIERERASKHRVGAIVRHHMTGADATIKRLPDDAAGYAAALYDTLHVLDDLGCDVIVIERVPDSPEWLGVRDRLERAAK